MLKQTCDTERRIVNFGIILTECPFEKHGESYLVPIGIRVYFCS